METCRIRLLRGARARLAQMPARPQAAARNELMRALPTELARKLAANPRFRPTASVEPHHRRREAAAITTGCCPLGRQPLCEGCAAQQGPRRTGGIRVRDGQVDGLQVHDPAPRTAVTGLADIPAQPCGRNRGDRSLRWSPTLTFECLFRVCRGRPRTSTAALVCGDPASDARSGSHNRSWRHSRGTRRRPIWCATMMAPTGRPSQVECRAMGIWDRPISPRSPWQNPYVERLIGDTSARLLGSCPDLGRTAFTTGPDFIFALLQ